MNGSRRTTQVQQQDNLAVAQGNIALNLINVYRALGGGWEIRTEKDNGSAAPMIDQPGPAEASAACGPEQLPPTPLTEPK